MDHDKNLVTGMQLWKRRWSKKKNSKINLIWRAIWYTRIRYLAVLFVLIWVGMGVRFLAGEVFYSEGKITEAFAGNYQGLSESTLEVTANYGSAFLTADDKKNLVRHVASQMGILAEGAVESSTSNEERSEFIFHKEARQAETLIKLVTLKETAEDHYLIVQLTIYGDNKNDILVYQEKLRGILEELGLSQKTYTTLQLQGEYDGKLNLDEMNKTADTMIGTLNGSVVYESRLEDQFTVYAYTGTIREYVTIGDTKINIQVAIRYDPEKDCTRVCLATPIIRNDW